MAPSDLGEGTMITRGEAPRRFLASRRAGGLTALAGLAGAVALAAPSSASAAGLIAAYEQHVPGSGFDIKLLNAGTGGALAVPAGVNTAADEFHPTLTPDGRYLVFVRAQLQPQLDGDIVPPAERGVFMADRQTGTVSAAMPERGTDDGAGPTIVKGVTPTLAYGNRFTTAVSPTQQRIVAAGAFNPSTTPDSFGFSTSLSTNGADVAAPTIFSDFVDVPHAAVFTRGTGRLKANSQFTFTGTSGGIIKGNTVLLDEVLAPDNTVATASRKVFGGADEFFNHAVPRPVDGYVALDVTERNSGAVDLKSLQFPLEQFPQPAPAPITTADSERMPAWSPDGVQLAFVRTTGASPRRKLLMFNTTSGIQDIQNAPIDLGADASTAALRGFQAAWGGIALANSGSADAPVISCGIACTGLLLGSTASISLAPQVAVQAASGKKIGIFVARVIGKRKLLGRSVARLKAVGRVPLGAISRGANRFRWNGRVNGRRLGAGTYLLTYRSLNRAGRILSTSSSVRITISATGQVTRARAER
jgi:WD40-like Beta Propeller Repeat